MSGDAWILAAGVDEIGNGEGFESSVEIDGEMVGLFCIGGEYFALGECTHEHGPLCQGMIDGHEVTCPWHSARFDIRSGKCLDAPSACRVNGMVDVAGDQQAQLLPPARSFEVKVADGNIYVRRRGAS